MVGADNHARRRRGTLAWVRSVEARQLPRRWGSDYLASQFATPKEAPPNSRPRRFYSALLQRDIHTLSVTEGEVAPVALHCPQLFEMWDQHMFSPWPDNHPAQGHPKVGATRLPSTNGTVRLAEQMGAFRRHPAVKDSEHGIYVPVPLLGDLLLFLMDELGPYCVEWDVKRSEGAHGLPLCASEVHASRREVVNARFKYELKRAYLQELGIPMVSIHRGTFDPVVVRNLKRLCDVHATSSSIDPGLQNEIIEAFRSALPDADPPSKVIAKFVRRGVSSPKVTELLDQAIWNLEIKVDLFQEIRCDLPLCPQLVDPFERYRELFARAPP